MKELKEEKLKLPVATFVLFASFDSTATFSTANVW